jgi:site-specific DNA-cytosine methylase
MLLQGLPEWYCLTGNLSAQVQQVSDSVPRQLAAALARRIRQSVVI